LLELEINNKGKKCGRRFKSDTMLEMYMPWEKEERMRTKNAQEKFG